MMYSPYSNSDSDNSSDLYPRSRRIRSERSKSKSSRKKERVSDGLQAPRDLSPLLAKRGLHLTSDVEPSCSYRNKVGINKFRRNHEREISKLLDFLEKESCLLDGIEEEKRAELRELQRQHEKEIKDMFMFLEKEMAEVTEGYTSKQMNLEEKLEKSQAKAREDVIRYKEQTHRLEDELDSVSQELKSSKHMYKYELGKVVGELDASLKQNAMLEEEVLMLRQKLAARDEQIRDLTKESSHIEEQLLDRIQRRDDELRQKDRVITQKDEEIRTLASRASQSAENSRNSAYQEKVVNVSIVGNAWEEASALTNYSDSDMRHGIRTDVSPYREKPQMSKYGLSPDRGGKPLQQPPASRRRDNRDDTESKRLNVSFSNEVERRHSTLPNQAYDNLSKRLEKMYIKR